MDVDTTESRVSLKQKKTGIAQVFKQIYYKFGLKHVVLLLILVIYSIVGAALFFWLEAPIQKELLLERQQKLHSARVSFIQQVFSQVFNDTNRFLLFVTDGDSKAIETILIKEVQQYEMNMSGLDQEYQMKTKWDLWNALLYAWTLITTIGYGYLYPRTDAGRIATMAYALFGIPLMLATLNDLGKLLTKIMKFPWFFMKKWRRRLFQFCSRMSRHQIKLAEAQDKENLEVFDLPIFVALAIVVGWIFVCSAILMSWESDWDYLVAFYFFFISLSTIGLGDIAPKDPKYLLFMFGNIVIGLSLVSMCINLIQSKLERTYDAGNQKETSENPESTSLNETIQPPCFETASLESYPETNRTVKKKRIRSLYPRRKSTSALYLKKRRLAKQTAVADQLIYIAPEKYSFAKIPYTNYANFNEPTPGAFAIAPTRDIENLNGSHDCPMVPLPSTDSNFVNDQDRSNRIKMQVNQLKRELSQYDNVDPTSVDELTKHDTSYKDLVL